MSQIWIPMPLPGLNEILSAAAGSPYALGRLKKKWGQAVVLYALKSQFTPVTGPSHFEFLCVEPDRTRDPDNVLGGAQKIIFDALKNGHLLPNDGWKYVYSIRGSWIMDKVHPGVRVTVTEA